MSNVNKEFLNGNILTDNKDCKIDISYLYIAFPFGINNYDGHFVVI